ncbi:Terpene synthase family, metal binding domain [Musa troglodytarum]|uniref:Terpene synthase family, metal binding domain n=1 Tax=Musa troglodytarum TaxID=320322 RepID=A0A9E7F5B2_9LILI|nr:Terpene synthase family, metal binding domain [Musa troglodytarum]
MQCDSAHCGIIDLLISTMLGHTISLLQHKWCCSLETNHGSVAPISFTSKLQYPKQQQLLVPNNGGVMSTTSFGSTIQCPKQLLVPNDHEELLYLKHKKNLMEARGLFYEAKTQFDVMLAIDLLQKLDIDYHFTDEIDAAIESLYNKRSNILCGETNNFVEVTLLFRLLRQARYPISSDVFHRFSDDGGEFMPSLTENIDGMISLFEASNLNTGENILRKANIFATDYLKSSMAYMEPDSVKCIQQTLDHPYHMSLQRYKARQYLKHQRREEGWKRVIQELARTDFVLIQSLHRKELNEITCWWKNLGLAQELRFARDQSVKWYTWSMTILPNPKFSNYRIALTKVISFIYLLDDIYDVSGSLDELHLFTKAINEWEISAIDSLPFYMRICYMALYNTTNEITQMWIALCNAFMVEAKWFAHSHVPMADDYMRNGTSSCGVPVVLMHIFFLLGQGLTHDNVNLMESYPKLISSPAKILRLWDDLGSAKDEKQNGFDGSYLECFMKENPYCSGQGARDHVMLMISKAWEELNRECFFYSSSFSQDFVLACLNMARMVKVMYTYDDEQKLPLLEECINLLLLGKV